MAAPPAKTTNDLNGNWIMNKALSDSSDPILQAQGIGYLTRKGVGLATIHLSINQHDAVPTEPRSSTTEVSYIETTQTASGLSSTKEIRYLDNVFRDHSDWLFGKVMAQARWVNVEDIEEASLKEGWLVEGRGKNLVLSYSMVEGERRYCMRVMVISKDKKKAQARFVYDYQLE
ncbi:hypothetical protein ACJZ2D_011618 [Fusarium nematophilum]